MRYKKIFVYADWVELEKPTLMGSLFVDILRGKEIISFGAVTNTGREFYSLVNPKHLNKVTPFITRLTGLTKEMFDESVQDRWHLPHHWKLVAQMPFGIPVESPAEKEFVPLKERFIMIKE